MHYVFCIDIVVQYGARDFKERVNGRPRVLDSAVIKRIGAADILL